MESSDETAITEITIRPDGRIYVFGMSQEVLRALAVLCPNDSAIQGRLHRVSSLKVPIAESVNSESLPQRALLDAREHAGSDPKTSESE
jgi:hypothetical protein